MQAGMPHSGLCNREPFHCISTAIKTNNAATALDFSQGMVLPPPPDQQHREKALVSPSHSNPAAAAAACQLGLGNREEMMLQGHPDSSLARQALTFFHHI